MKIQSKFIDYYDWVAGMYGGGDPKIFYKRDIIPDQGKQDQDFLYNNNWLVPYNGTPLLIDFLVKPWGNHFHTTDWRPHRNWLVVCGKAWPLFGLEHDYQWKIFDPNNPNHTNHQNVKVLTRESFLYRYIPRTPIGEEIPALIELCKKVGAPVFIVRHWLQKNDVDNTMFISVEEDIPNLGELGLTQFYEAERLYQDISYFVGNIINPSSDLQPPAKVGDKDRIVQHGFDLKQSFRHRK